MVCAGRFGLIANMCCGRKLRATYASIVNCGLYLAPCGALINGALLLCAKPGTARRRNQFAFSHHWCLVTRANEPLNVQKWHVSVSVAYPAVQCDEFLPCSLLTIGYGTHQLSWHHSDCHIVARSVEIVTFQGEDGSACCYLLVVVAGVSVHCFVVLHVALNGCKGTLRYCFQGLECSTCHDVERNDCELFTVLVSLAFFCMPISAIRRSVSRYLEGGLNCHSSCFGGRVHKLAS